MSTLRWTHNTITANALGLAIQGGENDSGTHVIAVGGFATADLVTNYESFEDLMEHGDGWYPIAATVCMDTASPSMRYGMIGFHVPPGRQVRAHVWTITEE